MEIKMNNDMLIEQGIIFAAKKLDIDPIEYAIDEDGVLKGKDLTSIYNPLEKYILLNGTWGKNAPHNELLLVVFHELRHHYQRQQIELFTKKLKLKEDVEVVKQWKDDFDNYNSPFKSDLATYINQSIEVDADKFARELVDEIFKGL